MKPSWEDVPRSRFSFPSAFKMSTWMRRRREIAQALRGSQSLLMVDDEKSTVRTLEMTLRRLGYQVTAFTSPTKALEALRQRPGELDTVVTGQTMAKLRGFELAKQLLLTRADLPATLCTEHSDTVKESNAKDAGIREFLKKATGTRHWRRVSRCLSRANAVGSARTRCARRATGRRSRRGSRRSFRSGP